MLRYITQIIDSIWYEHVRVSVYSPLQPRRADRLYPFPCQREVFVVIVAVCVGIEVPGFARIIRLNVEPKAVDDDIRSVDVGDIIVELALHRVAGTTSTFVLVAGTWFKGEG